MKLTINSTHLYYLGLSFKATDIAREVYKRAILDADNKYDAKDKLYEALCDEMIWTNRRWTIMAEYQTPTEANYDEALELFFNDLWRCCDGVIDEEDDEEETALTSL